MIHILYYYYHTMIMIRFELVKPENPIRSGIIPKVPLEILEAQTKDKEWKQWKQLVVRTEPLVTDFSHGEVERSTILNRSIIWNHQKSSEIRIWNHLFYKPFSIPMLNQRDPEGICQDKAFREARNHPWSSDMIGHLESQLYYLAMTNIAMENHHF